MTDLPAVARVRRALPLLLILAAGCATTDDDNDPPAYPQLLAAMQNLQAAQKRFDASTTLPQTFDFPGQGKVVVREASLDGYPGNTYVRCRFHYLNDTGKPVVRALVSLDVLDADAKLVASQVSICIFPTPRAIYDGTWYADELRTQTHEAHVKPGWSWRVTCKTEFEPEATGGQ